jgi:hypothetical protein
VGVAIAGRGPKTEIVSAAVPRKVKRDVDAFAHGAGFSRSEATALLILAGLAILSAFAAADEAARVLGDQKKVKRLAPRVLRKSLELIRTVERGE